MDDDRELLDRVRELDQEALGQVYDTFRPGLYRYALRQLGQPELAEECVSATFEAFLYGLSEGHGPREYLQAYLYRIAHNWISDFWQEHQRAPQEQQLCEEGTLADGEPTDHAARLIRQQSEERLRQAIAKLTPDQRQVIVLKFIEGWSNRDVARVLGKPVGAVKSLQYRGLRALERILTAPAQGDGKQP
ncbi:MAG: sigma-70 family RNA polymerase sigma factor [Anaerolineae bacterium]|nr:sigma-70 family RNA polymerase sigma factor [Anaerolineae bacterium]